ncbi:PQ loop repeat-domain-containing protein [Xylariales sp. PMI_506]|nr:PQ loop repeat-domain-containing protein [Xylariales sp. PMI_506]
MAPQTTIPVAANVLGTIGTILWCVQLIPQIWTNWRTKKTDGLPSFMMFLWAFCAVPAGAYAIIQNFNLPLQIQPQIFMALCLVSWSQTLMYGRKWPAWKAMLAGVGLGFLFGCMEASLIVGLAGLYQKGYELPVSIVGIAASVLLAAGLLPPYGQIWTRRGRVVGINWVFLAMDWSGAFFSLMALAAQNTFDVLGGVMYITCCVLEIGIFSSQLIWLLRTRRIRAEAARRGQTFDDVAAEMEAKGVAFKFAERKKSGKETSKMMAPQSMDEVKGSGARTHDSTIPRKESRKLQRKSQRGRPVIVVPQEDQKRLDCDLEAGPTNINTSRLDDLEMSDGDVPTSPLTNGIPVAREIGDMV